MITETQIFWAVFWANLGSTLATFVIVAAAKIVGRDW